MGAEPHYRAEESGPGSCSTGKCVSPNKERRWSAPVGRYKMPIAAMAAIQMAKKLCYVSSELLPILPLNRLHLVFEPQLQLLEPNFLQLFVFAEITFFGERF